MLYSCYSSSAIFRQVSIRHKWNRAHYLHKEQSTFRIAIYMYHNTWVSPPFCLWLNWLLLYQEKYIHAHSPGYDTNLPVSRTGNQKEIKLSYTVWAFLCFNFNRLSYFCSKFEFSLIYSSVSGPFLHLFHHWQRLSWKWIVMVCTSCKTSYNVLSNSRLSGGSGSGSGDGWSLIFEGGGVMQKKRVSAF